MERRLLRGAHILRGCILALVLLFFCLQEARTQTQATRAWVVFRDKGGSTTSFSPSALGISERALKRRAKVLPPDRLIDKRDLPVAQAYIDQVQARGFKIHAVSRWFNAVSVEATSEQLAALGAIPSVRSVQAVPTTRRPDPVLSSLSSIPTFSKKELGRTLNYGPSFTQLQNMRVPDVHSLGINASGVLVGMIDDGFNSHRTHNALKRASILAEYDWIQADSNTSAQAGDAGGQGNHGCYTMSALGGFDNGNLIGPAYGATFVLAKTEYDPTETQIELDRYVAALEWMERLGADVVSTSLGYDDLDPFGVYNPGDIVFSMKDGHTAVTSEAASVAASKGVLLVTAMGNEGPWRYGNNWRIIPGVTGSMITPADADSIIAVGASFSDGLLASFSSTGPTSDDRIKPEVVAQGVSVVSADPNNPAGYVGVSGTSLSTPLTAGVAALVISAHPELTPMQVREAMIKTAVHINDTDTSKHITGWPNNWYGYGFVNAFEAVLYHGLVFGNRPLVTLTNSSFEITTWIKSKNPLDDDSLFLYYKKPRELAYQRALLSPSGKPDQYVAHILRSEMDSTSIGYFFARDNSGAARRSPSSPDSLFSLALTPNRILDMFPTGIPQEYKLSQNYPNPFPSPFNPKTTIEFSVPKSEEIELAVFNLLGQKVRTLFNGVAAAGQGRATWDGTNESNMVVSTGIYFYRLKTPSSVLTGKMLYIK
ncbi:MAG: S8 family peptidase [Bacteroidota bacterium]